MDAERAGSSHWCDAEYITREGDERIADLEASLAAAERRAEAAEMERDEQRDLKTAMDDRMDEAERRLALAREALERINDDEHAEHCHLAQQVRGECQCALVLAAVALTALDGEGDAE